MTWSIVARDPETGHLGIAVATRFFAVGGVVPHIRGGVGAIATQAFVNPLYGIDGLTLLARGRGRRRRSSRHSTAATTAATSGSFISSTRDGRNAAYTGAQLHRLGRASGRRTASRSPATCWPDRRSIAETLETYTQGCGKPLAERLLEAMEAGEEAGGDKRGRQSAALVIYRDQDYAWLNLRVDDHADPLAELRRLYAVAQERYLHVAETMPTRQNPSGMIDRREIDETIAAAGSGAHRGRPPVGFLRHHRRAREHEHGTAQNGCGT